MLLSEKKVKGRIQRIKVSRTDPAVSHLMYDDILVMGRANAKEATVIKNCFDRNCSWYEEAIKEKSSTLFFKSMSRAVKAEIKKILEFKEMAKDSLYLGYNFVLSRNLIWASRTELARDSRDGIATFSLNRGMLL